MDTLRDIGEFATVEATCQGAPVYAFGYTYVWGLAPDFIPGLSWQRSAEGRTSPGEKIVPKKSWEITRNLLGSTPAREPRTLRIDDQPLLCIHLIDGDPETCWCSRGQIEADVEPVWVRIDLPIEDEIAAVRLVPSRKGMRGAAPLAGEGTANLPVGQGLPTALTVRLSRDAHRWDTVHHTTELSVDPAMGPIELRFEPRRPSRSGSSGRGSPRYSASATASPSPALRCCRPTGGTWRSTPAAQASRSHRRTWAPAWTGSPRTCSGPSSTTSGSSERASATT